MGEDAGEINSQWRELSGPGIPPMSEFEAHTLDRESLQEFADVTGGKAFYNRNDLDAITGEAIASGSDYYSISYTPPVQGFDGKYHSIDVKVDQPGLTLQFRKGYTSLDLAKLNNSIDPGKLSKAAGASSSLPACHQPIPRAHGPRRGPPPAKLLLAARITPPPPPPNQPRRPSKATSTLRSKPIRSSATTLSIPCPPARSRSPKTPTAPARPPSSSTSSPTPKTAPSSTSCARPPTSR